MKFVWKSCIATCNISQCLTQTFKLLKAFHQKLHLLLKTSRQISTAFQNFQKVQVNQIVYPWFLNVPYMAFFDSSGFDGSFLAEKKTRHSAFYTPCILFLCHCVWSWRSKNDQWRSKDSQTTWLSVFRKVCQVLTSFC